MNTPGTTLMTSSFDWTGWPPTYFLFGMVVHHIVFLCKAILTLEKANVMFDVRVHSSSFEDLKVSLNTTFEYELL